MKLHLDHIHIIENMYNFSVIYLVLTKYRAKPGFIGMRGTTNVHDNISSIVLLTEEIT